MDHGDSGCDLVTRVSIRSKSTYILNSLVEAGYFVDVHSTAIAKGNGRIKKQKIQYDNYNINYMLSFGRDNLLTKYISLLFIYLQILYLWFSSPREDDFLLYHSVQLTKLFHFLQRFSKRHRLFIEVEEVYSVVYQLNQDAISNELRSLRGFDGYIVVNENLQQLCGLDGKCVVCHGKYSPLQTDDHRIDMENIKVLYAGELNEDMWLAVEVAKLLPLNYHLIILGYGNETAINKLRGVCEAGKNSHATIEYGGCLAGEEYDRFTRGCDVGLCTRVVDGESSLYAFPSKILAYLSSNIITVSTPLQSILSSKLSSVVQTSSDFTAASIAKTLQNSIEKQSVVNYSMQLQSYHYQFVNELKSLFTC